MHLLRHALLKKPCGQVQELITMHVQAEQGGKAHGLHDGCVILSPAADGVLMRKGAATAAISLQFSYDDVRE